MLPFRVSPSKTPLQLTDGLRDEAGGFPPYTGGHERHMGGYRNLPGDDCNRRRGNDSGVRRQVRLPAQLAGT